MVWEAIRIARLYEGLDPESEGEELGSESESAIYPDSDSDWDTDSDIYPDSDAHHDVLS